MTQPLTVNPASDDAAISCRHCGRVHNLFVRVRSSGEIACPAARIIPMDAPSMHDVQEAENRIRDKMQRLGGPDAYRVRSGKS